MAFSLCAVAERRRYLWRLLPALLVVWSCAAAEVLPPKPANYFNDYAGVVSPAVAQQLNRTLEDFEKATSSQVVVAVFPGFEVDSSLEDYTHRVFQKWAIGQKGKDNGAALFVFVKDRKLRIEVGYGLEGALPDALAKRIIEDEIKPGFQRGDYGAGLSAGVTAMLQAARGEYKGTGRSVAQTKANRHGVPPLLLVLVVFIIVANIIRRVVSGTVYHSGGRSCRSVWYWGGGSSGWSGGGGWGGGGGGFGGGGGGFSGGGGSSGGGGASGSW
jgi:uncharacterized protein